MTALVSHLSSPAKHRWRVITIFFIFLLLHQCDKLLIGPLMKPIMDTFKLDYTQWGLINTLLWAKEPGKNLRPPAAYPTHRVLDGHAAGALAERGDRMAAG
jgi:hypothetical protein